MNRNTVALAAASVAVLVVIILGFRTLGGPATQRKVQSDLRRVTALAGLAHQINSKWVGSGKKLPGTLQELGSTAKEDPITHKAFEYRPKQDDKYQLCASFEADSPDTPETNVFWKHPKGDYCFEFDVSQQVAPTPYYY